MPLSELLLIEFFPKLTMTLSKNVITLSVYGVVILSFRKRLFTTGSLIRFLHGVDRPVNTEALCIGYLIEALRRTVKSRPFVSFLGLAVSDVFLIQQSHNVLATMRTNIAFRFKWPGVRFPKAII